ncbi:ketopantoate reductase family protein [Hyphococcus luteus]|uniref:ketopantoate reductase family protein n=1 Tax=Hyphococcus luteus TaxID=2058213 RepID=UPI001A9C5EC1|nr:ketopantoate reductase family protein [Marinicaulis flavus]
MKNIVIIGAGAMGCLFAARMSEAGAHVTLIDVDRARLDLLAQGGVELIDDKGRRTVRVEASLAENFDGPADLVMLFTKGAHSAAAVASVKHLAAQKPAALTLQNGIGNAERLAEIFGADRVLMGTAHIPADLTGPKSVETHGFAHLHIGGFTGAAHEYAAPAAALLEKSGFETHVTAEIESAVWEKLAFNAALNAVAMICEAPNGAMNNPAGRRIADAVTAETVAVASARGLTLDHEGVRDNIARALADHPGHKASMLQDREAGRATEIETINGALAQEGERLNVPTPVTQTLADLVRVIEAKSH